MRVVIADDSKLLREGLARLLHESGVEVCASTGDPEGLVAAVDRWRPDVAIIDIRMPPTFTHEGAVTAIELRKRLGRGLIESSSICRTDVRSARSSTCCSDLDTESRASLTFRVGATPVSPIRWTASSDAS
jgi:DNA-binding NarL/FixJ family response regulator